MNFYLLGALGIGDGVCRMSAPRGLSSTVFALLLLRFNQPVEPEVLIESLWSERRPVSANANLRQYISRIRLFLHDFAPRHASRIQRTHGGYLLAVQRHELDLTCFEDLADEGRRAYDDKDLPRACARLSRALSLWCGEICPGARRGPALEAHTRYWEERRLEASRLLLQSRLGLRDYDRAIAEVHQLISHDPFREDVWATLMLALYRSHRRGEALQTFHLARRRFVRELGIEPSLHLQRLHQVILNGDDPHDYLAGSTPSEFGPGATGAVAPRAG